MLAAAYPGRNDPFPLFMPPQSFKLAPPGSAAEERTFLLLEPRLLLFHHALVGALDGFHLSLLGTEAGLLEANPLPATKRRHEPVLYLRSIAIAGACEDTIARANASHVKF